MTSTETCRACHSPPAHGRRPFRCEQCKAVFYCSSGCRNLHQASHRSYCRPPRRNLPTSAPKKPVTGVCLRGGPDIPFNPSIITLLPEHAVWTTGRVSPLSQLMDMPILIHREQEELPLEHHNITDLDNQAVTYLMVDPQTGLAPERWTRNIGEVTIVRADQQPLSISDLETLFVFCQNLLSVFTFTRRSPNPAEAYTSEAFQRFGRQYREACAAARDGADATTLDYTDNPVPLNQIPLEATTSIATTSSARGLQWLDIGPTARRRITRHLNADILPNGQIADVLTFDDFYDYFE